MKIHLSERGNSKVAIIESSDIIISDVQGALDLMAQVQYEFGCDKIIINKSSISEDFFHLKSGLAGEILQKFTNYNMKIAIVGDFDVYESKSLKDFIYESNKGKKILFLKDEQAALKAFHNIP